MAVRKAEIWKERAAELRRVATTTREPERERKMLALADEFEEAANSAEQVTTPAEEGR
jgi:anaerobic glycerol-3-phosphate dehydrogenase